MVDGAGDALAEVALWYLKALVLLLLKGLGKRRRRRLPFPPLFLKMYMLVESHLKSILHLKRSPSIRSWSLLVGISSIGLAAAYYSEDSLGWKLFYLAGCFFVAVQNLEEWEEAIFDKDAGKVFLKTFNLYKKLLTLSKAGHEQVVVPLDEIRAVNVEEEKVRYFGKGYLVVLRFGTGFSHPLTQNAVMGCRSDVEAVAKLITSFLELNKMSAQQELEDSSETDVTDEEEPKDTTGCDAQKARTP